MADISVWVSPNNTEYNFKDAAAREAIAAINGREWYVVTNAADTPYGVTWDKGGTTITGTLVASADTKAKIYFVPDVAETGKDIYSEWVTVSPTSGTFVWEKFGTTDINVGSLGLLAYKDSASGSFTPAGTVSQPTFSGESMNSTGTFTPAGAIQVNASSGSGTSYTPEGSVQVNASSGSGTSYTPEGSVAAPTISVASAGSTATIKNPTKQTVAKALQTAAPGATAPSNPITYFAVEGEKLKMYQIGYTTGDSISTEDVTVKTGDASYSASAPAFTGTEKKFAFSGTEKKLAFSGTQGNVSVSGTPSGTVSQPTFTGSEGTVTVE